MLRTSVSNSYCERTMSPIVTRGNSCSGCRTLLEGDDEIPLAIASPAIKKNRDVSTAPTASEVKSCSEVPVNHVGNKMAFERSLLSVPDVR